MKRRGPGLPGKEGNKKSPLDSNSSTATQLINFAPVVWPLSFSFPIGKMGMGFIWISLVAKHGQSFEPIWNRWGLVPEPKHCGEQRPAGDCLCPLFVNRCPVAVSSPLLLLSPVSHLSVS